MSTTKSVIISNFDIVDIANSILLVQPVSSERPFDPYPYILLNLFLSMLAPLQSPVIMMSQNRQTATDHLDAAHDYEVIFKAELKILNPHKKLDELSENKWSELMALQQEQIKLLNKFVNQA